MPHGAGILPTFAQHKSPSFVGTVNIPTPWSIWDNMGHQKSTRTPGLVLDLTGRPGHETNQTTGEALEHAEHNHIYNKGTPPWGGCGFSTIVYLLIESKITFLHCNLQYFMVVIYDVLTFGARGQNAKKKLLQFRNICLRFNAFFFPQCSFSRHSSFWRACPKSGCIDAGVQI